MEGDINAEGKQKATEPKIFVKNKSPKSSPSSSPRSVDLTNEAEAEEKKAPCTGTPPKQDVDELAKFMALLHQASQKDKPESPKKLCTLEKDEIEIFLRSYIEYGKKGGKKQCTDFMDPMLLKSMKDYELENGSKSTYHDVLHFLKQRTKPRDVDDILLTLNTRVKIDPTAKTGETKLFSLMTSLTDAVDSSKSSGDFIFSFRMKKKLILSKLPSEFRKEFEKFSAFMEEPSDMREFYKQLKSVEEKFNGSWDDADSGSEFTEEYEDSPFFKKAQEDHTRAVRNARKKKNL